MKETLGIEERNSTSRKIALYRIGVEGSSGYLAHINKMGNDVRNLRAVCQQHGSVCRCWITPRTAGATEQSVLNDLVEWSGKADCTSASAHDEQSEQLRIKYGIKPKAKKQ